MSEYAYGIYESIINATGSELILFFVILAVIAVPFYIVVLKGRKADKQHELRREQQFIEVIKENSTVMAGLKVVLENSGATTEKTLDRIHTRIDDTEKSLTTISSDIAEIKAKQYVTTTNHTEMASKINKIMLIVSGGNIPPDNGTGRG